MIPARPFPRSKRTMLAAVLVSLALAVFAPLQGGVSAQASAPPTSTAALAERGKSLYLELHCGACHALRAAGSAGIFGPAQDAIGVIALARVADPAYAGSAESAAAYLRESIVAPAAYIVPGYAFTRHPMPAYDIAEEDLEALVSFLLQRDGS